MGSDKLQDAGDAMAVGVLFVALIDWLPVVISLLSAVWFLFRVAWLAIQIWESDTVKRFTKRGGAAKVNTE